MAKVYLTAKSDTILSYRKWQESLYKGNTNAQERERMKKVCISAIKTLPDKQKLYLTEHFLNDKPMVEIAQIYGVNKSTVSRTISRAISNIQYITKHFQ